jgi:hypothetical protein
MDESDGPVRALQRLSGDSVLGAKCHPTPREYRIQA